MLLKIVFLFVSSYTLCNAHKPCSKVGLVKMDQVMAKFLGINSGRKFPTNKLEERTKWCNESAIYVTELSKWSIKCMDGLSQQVARILIYAVKNAMNNYCRKDSKKLDQLIAAVPCVNQNNAVIVKCYTNMIDAFLGIKWADNKLKIPHLCCEYARLHQCFRDKLSSAKYCNDQSIVTIGDILRQIIGNVTDLLCGEYTDESDQCDKLSAPPMKRKSQKRTRSFLPPVLDILDSFPEV